MAEPVSPLVLITGASSGIGQALAWRFHQAGYRLALVARRGADIEAWAHAQGMAPAQYQAYSVDVTHADAMLRMGEDCLRRQGLPDVVIANAGISVGIDTACREDIDVMARVLATNNVGMMATFHPFVRAMVERAARRGPVKPGSSAGGKLVGICSVAGIRGIPGHGAYSASKAAAIAYCESLRGDLRPAGVRVITLCPGYVATPLTSKNRHSMPFLMTPQAFAEQAFRAIEADASYRVIPWQMAVVAKLLRLLPNAVFDRVFASRPRKPRQHELH